MNSPAVPLSRLIGSRVRELRERARLRQEDIATVARSAGLDWIRPTVAQIESGQRRLTLEEFLLLPQILEDAGAGDLWLENLLPTSGHAFLTPLLAADANGLRAMLRGENRVGTLAQAAAMPGTVVRDIPDVPGLKEARALWRRWWDGRPDAGVLYRAALASRDDAVVKAARALDTSPVAVALASESRWGRSLAEERDARVTAHQHGGEVPLRTTQALRGHVTRALIEELRPTVPAPAPPGKKPKRARR